MYLRLPGERRRYFDLLSDLTVTGLQPEDATGLFTFWDELLIECERLVLAIAAVWHGVEISKGVEESPDDTVILSDPYTFQAQLSTVSSNNFQGVFRFTPFPRFESCPFRANALEKFDVVTETVTGDLLLPFYGWTELRDDAPKRFPSKPVEKQFDLEGSITKLLTTHEKVEEILCSARTAEPQLLKKIGDDVRREVRDRDWEVLPCDKWVKFLRHLKETMGEEAVKEQHGVPALMGTLSGQPEIAAIKDLSLIDISDRVSLHLFNERLQQELTDSEMLARYNETFWELLKQIRPAETRPARSSPPRVKFDDAVYNLTVKIRNLTPNRSWEMFGESLKSVGIKDLKDFKDLCTRSKNRSDKQKNRAADK